MVTNAQLRAPSAQNNFHRLGTNNLVKFHQILHVRHKAAQCLLLIGTAETRPQCDAVKKIPSPKSKITPSHLGPFRASCRFISMRLQRKNIPSENVRCAIVQTTSRIGQQEHLTPHPLSWQTSLISTPPTPNCRGGVRPANELWVLGTIQKTLNAGTRCMSQKEEGL